MESIWVFIILFTGVIAGDFDFGTAAGAFADEAGCLRFIAWNIEDDLVSYPDSGFLYACREVPFYGGT